MVVKMARLSDDPTFSTMFLDEARLAARLSHPNIVQTFEVGQESNRDFIVMEYLDGPTMGRLRHLAKPFGGIPLRFSLQVLSQVLEGLSYAHRAQDYEGKPLHFVHRDLTPQNVIVTTQGIAKILDFGIAKATDNQNVTQAGLYKGKLSYMPPEQVSGASIDARADLFAVGVMLAEAISGRRYWGEATGSTVFARLISGDLPPVSELGAEPWLEQICAKALAANRDHRYETASAFKADLDRGLVAQWTLSHEELADYVQTLTAETRAARQAVIDRQLRASCRSPASTRRPSSRSWRGPARRPGQPIAMAVRRHASRTPPPLPGKHAPGQAPGDIQIDVQDGSDNSSGTTRAGQPTEIGRSGSFVDRLDSLAGASASRRRLLMGIGAGAVVIALILVVALVVMLSHSGTTTAPQPPLAALHPDTARPQERSSRGRAPERSRRPSARCRRPAPSTRFASEVLVSPPEATIRIDGQGVEMNPYVGTYTRDRQVHVLTVDADEYKSTNRKFMLDHDVLIQLRLQQSKTGFAKRGGPPGDAHEHRADAAPAAAARRDDTPAPAPTTAAPAEATTRSPSRRPPRRRRAQEPPRPRRGGLHQLLRREEARSRPGRL